MFQLYMFKQLRAWLDTNQSLNRLNSTTHMSCLLLLGLFIPQAKQKWSKNYRMWVIGDSNTVSNAHPLTFFPTLLPLSTFELIQAGYHWWVQKPTMPVLGWAVCWLHFASCPRWRTRAWRWHDAISADGYSCLSINSWFRIQPELVDWCSLILACVNTHQHHVLSFFY